MKNGKPLILLVDDDHDFLKIHEELLEGFGYRVKCFTNPDNVIDFCEREKPDLIITDIMMGTVDSGFSLARAVKEHEDFNEIPLIIVSAVKHKLSVDFNPKDEKELETIGADAFFEKPLEITAVREKIHELINSKE